MRGRAGGRVLPGRDSWRGVRLERVSLEACTAAMSSATATTIAIIPVALYARSSQLCASNAAVMHYTVQYALHDNCTMH